MEMMNRKTALAVMLGLSALAFNASAHGPSKAQYGGVVQTASDLSFELANEGDKAALYIVDHDAPADASKMSGKLKRQRSEEHTSELQSPDHLVCRLLLEKKKKHSTTKQTT